MVLKKPAYRSKHPCVACLTGYGDCAAGWTMGLQCCKACNHPTRWLPDPWTPQDRAEMVQEAAHVERRGR